MNSLIQNYINGNLTDAKRQAARYDLFSIARALRNDYGYSRNAATMIASFLKGRCTFQAACDAENAQRDRMPL